MNRKDNNVLLFIHFLVFKFKNMYYQYQRAPRKRGFDYIKPFIIILIIIGIIVVGWRLLNNMFLGESIDTLSQKVFLNIESGSVKAMTATDSEWKNVPDNIYLYEGESLKTKSDGRATLTFFDQSIVRLDKNSEVKFSSIKKVNEATNIELDLVEGKAWANIDFMSDSDSSFTTTTDLITVDSRGGVLAVTYPGTVYVVSGSAQVALKHDDEIIKSVNVGVGQELMVDAKIIQDINEGLDKEILFALDDSFKASNWYRWNRQKDSALTAFEESEDEVIIEEEEIDEEEVSEEDEAIISDRLLTVTRPASGTETNKNTISAEGLYDESRVSVVYINGASATLSGNKWNVSSIMLGDGENEISVEVEDGSGQRTKMDSIFVTFDDVAPVMPVIEEPGSNDEEVTIADIEQIISGTVSKDTEAVIVNDYRLSKYVPGSEEFTYYAKMAYANLEVGENEYEVIAEDKAGNQSDTAKIILILEQETVDEKKAESEDEVSDDSEPAAATSSGGVKITSPNNGESFETTETAFEIKGNVPSNTAKVIVNDYQLQAFEAGDTTFKYRANSTLGTLVIGQNNTYTVKAYDDEDELLGSASISIDVESGSDGAPAFTMPTSDSTYTTSLDQLVIGGTVGKWVKMIYINGEKLNEYIPGSEEWSKTVTLNEGENVFEVYGTNGEETPKVKLTITYQP